MELTLEEAIKNEAGWQEELAIAKQAVSDSPTLFNRKRVADAKAALEFYNGYVKHDYIRDYDGNIVRFSRNSKGEIVEDPNGLPRYDTNTVLERKGGIIQFLAGEAQRLKASSDLGKRFSDRTFGNFDVNRNREAYGIATTYAEREDLFESSRNCLILLGDVGTGKTHLAAAITNTLIDRGIPVLFGTFTEHLQHIKDEFDNASTDTYLSKMKSTPMLVLDDVGKERRSEWTQSILFDVINYRYEHLLPIVITGNFDDSGLYNYAGNAVASRLNEMSIAVHTKGTDYRRTK